MTTETYAYGYKTREAAELAIISEMENDMLSRSDRPRVRAYKTRLGKTRYRILIDVDLGHWDPTTDLAGC